MDLQKKQSCILFRSVVEAAEELDKETALELLLTYSHYALGDIGESEINNHTQIVKLILKQNLESLSAAERRYNAAVENGKKGAEQGKRKGGGVGRPRKGESQEDYQNRVKEWKETKSDEIIPQKTPLKPDMTIEDEKKDRAHNLAKNYKKADEKYGRGASTLTTNWIYKNILSGQKCSYCGETDWRRLGCDRIDNTKPHTEDNVVCSCAKCNIERGQKAYEDFAKEKSNNYPPENPLNVDVYVDNDVYKEEYVYIDNNNYSNNNIVIDEEEFYKKIDNLCIKFINKHSEYNYLYDVGGFMNNYYDNVCRFKLYLNENLNSQFSLEDCCILILDCFKRYSTQAI